MQSVRSDARHASQLTRRALKRSYLAVGTAGAPTRCGSIMIAYPSFQRSLRGPASRCTFTTFGAALLVPVLAVDLAGDAPLKHPWRLVDGRHWQIVAEGAEDRSPADATEAHRPTCPEGMLDVHGAMKLDGDESIEELQKTACMLWVDQGYPERCGEFDRATWLRISAHLRTRSMGFCIDRFEYPNRAGEYPLVAVTWHEAAASCGRSGKRLCTEAEWTFACEGEEAAPYPNGYVRDPVACVIDRPWRFVNEAALLPREGRVALREIDRLWQGEPSGTHPGCRSPFGVDDMIGNVDEWTLSVRPGERPSILKGGYWGPVRTRCRPSTRAHGEDYFFYQQGFRCCADAATRRAPAGG